MIVCTKFTCCSRIVYTKTSPVSPFVLPSIVCLLYKNSIEHYRCFCRREESKDRLMGKSNGTFLVRPKGVNIDDIPVSEPTHSHTIDIM